MEEAGSADNEYNKGKGVNFCHIIYSVFSCYVLTRLLSFLLNANVHATAHAINSHSTFIYILYSDCFNRM
jgi:hypothetical protein